MKQIDIKDLELELKVLQKKDTEDALAQGFTNKDDWALHKLNTNEKDEVADAIINMAQRYEISQENLAVSFDKSLSMYLRVQNSKKMLKQKEKKEKK